MSTVTTIYLLVVYISSMIYFLYTGTKLWHYLQILKNKKIRALTITCLVFICMSLLSLLVAIVESHFIKKGFHILISATEIYLMYQIIDFTLRKSKAKDVIKLLLCFSAPYLLFSFKFSTDDPRNHFLYAYISLVLVTASMIYFKQLEQDITSIDITKQPETLLQLGVFFCNTLPLILSCTWISIYLFDQNLATYLAKANDGNELFKLALSVEGLCYLLLMYFINKSYKWIILSYT